MTDARPHLRLIRTRRGRAALRGGGGKSERTIELEKLLDRRTHVAAITEAASAAITDALTRRMHRSAAGLPPLPAAVPLMLAVDEKADLSYLRTAFGFEVLADEDGAILAATEDHALGQLKATLDKYLNRIRGQGSGAKLHEVRPENTRLQQLLDDRLLSVWATIADTDLVVVDIAVSCTGMDAGKSFPSNLAKLSEEQQERKLRELGLSWDEVYRRWDALRDQRVEALLQIVEFYGGSTLGPTIDGVSSVFTLPDSAQVRVRISGLGLRDIVQNFPYVFEAGLPEDLEQVIGGEAIGPNGQGTAAPPSPDAPTVCVVDSGVQEQHRLLSSLVRPSMSRRFLEGRGVADDVSSGGHGTRVAGAAAWGDAPGEGVPACWIANAKVLDADVQLPEFLQPPLVARAVVEHYADQGVRLFVHSINSAHAKRRETMSAWAAEFDRLAAELDVLVVQSAGNIPRQSSVPGAPGVREHLEANREYPRYFGERSAQVTNPAFGMHCLTVGSLSKEKVSVEGWQTIAPTDHASAFSRSGPGMWDAIKPDVVEYAGDYGLASNPLQVDVPGLLKQAYPRLVRATTREPGPAVDASMVGTSFAAPKVARVAAMIAQELPHEPALAYRALLVNSARWPEHVESRAIADSGVRLQALSTMGYGVPSAERATTSTDSRTTLFSQGENRIRAREAHVYEVALPEALRAVASSAEVLVEVTLAFTAIPRRTRRRLGGYLSTWVDWEASKRNEDVDAFLARVLKDQELATAKNELFAWTLGRQVNSGLIDKMRRNLGSVQKDWARIAGDELPEHFCIAVVGHPGWDQRPDASARYCLCVTIEILEGSVGELSLYNEIEALNVELPVELET